MSGIYQVPDMPAFFGFVRHALNGLQYSTTFISQTGAWYNRQAQVTDANGTTQTITVDPHFGRFDRLNDWDQSVSKKFKIAERQSFEITWNLFNTMNANTIRGWSTTNVNSSSYLQPDKVTPLRPSSTGILAPRIYEWTARYRF